MILDKSYYYQDTAVRPENVQETSTPAFERRVNSLLLDLKIEAAPLWERYLCCIGTKSSQTESLPTPYGFIHGSLSYQLLKHLTSSAPL